MAAGDGSVFEPLGRAVEINKGTALEELGNTLNAHRAALLELKRSGDVAGETIARMTEEAGGILARAKKESAVEWQPAGNAGELDARYFGENGVTFGKRAVGCLVPDGRGNLVEGQEVRYGLLDDPHTVTVEHERLRRAFAGYAFARKLVKPGSSPSPARLELQRKAFAAFRSAALAMPGQTGGFLRRMFDDPAMLKRVISGTAGSGGELVAVPTISDLRRPYDLARNVVGLVPSRQASASSFKQPQRTGRAIARKRGATAASPAVYPVQTWTTSDTTLTLVERVINVLLDDSFIEEASLVLDNPMGEVMDFILSGDADTLEMAFLHGDTAATHEDTIATWRMGTYYASGDLDGSSSPLKFWIGFRARAFDDSNTVAGGAAFTAAVHYGALNAMGNLASGAKIITGLTTFYTMLLANALFTTVDKFGPKATLTTGQLGSIGDTPIVISEFMKSELASTGLYTGSGTTGSMIYVNPMAWTFYESEGHSTEWDVTYPEQGATYVGIKRKALLAPTCLSTEKPVGLVINM